MKLIADAGGTKTDWVLIGPDGTVQTFESPGINALMLGEQELRAAFAAAVPATDCSEVYYYGAGCVDAGVCAKVAAALPCGKVREVCSDLLGAARALYGHGSGFVGILGTGSNTGYYDGNAIVRNMPPLGFILGDEGGGAAIGRELLRRVYRSGFMRKEFEDWLGTDYAGVLERVYRRPGANAYMASLVRFVAEHRRECASIVETRFDSLMREIIGFYRPQGDEELRLTGGVACEFESEIRAAGLRHGLRLTRVMRRPMEGLIEYHKNS